MKAGEEEPTWERVLELPTSLAIPGESLFFSFSFLLGSLAIPGESKI